MKRLKDDFDVPSAIFLEPIPKAPLITLLFLISQSMTRGECSPGIHAIMRHTHLSDYSTRSALHWLKRKGWISQTRRRGSGLNMLIHIRIPTRLRPATPVNVIEAKEQQFKVV